ncbi:hypothetical protein [Runella zeae]|uniref:hypothetical protein n=1 Tax=Runella zeae TaxID=94255 RepID=UPI000426A7E1|nr:hypothetical protein [Runella zeae]
MKNVFCNLVFLAMLGVCTSSFAQDDKDDTHTIQITIPEVALLDIEPSGSKNISLAFTAPTEAGNPITAPTANNSLWLNYSSIVASTGETSRTVSVQITSGTVPSGADLTLQAAAPSGSNGGGTIANSASSTLTLSGSSQTLLTGIGSGYTGNGANNGHQLTYNLALASGAYSDLKYDASTTVTVTYTISDQ